MFLLRTNDQMAGFVHDRLDRVQINIPRQMIRTLQLTCHAIVQLADTLRMLTANQQLVVQRCHLDFAWLIFRDLQVDLETIIGVDELGASIIVSASWTIA